MPGVKVQDVLHLWFNSSTDTLFSTVDNSNVTTMLSFINFLILCLSQFQTLEGLKLNKCDKNRVLRELMQGVK